MPYGRLITDAQLRSQLLSARDDIDPAFLLSWVPIIENAVEQYLNRKLSFTAGIVEWHGSSDDAFILLDQTPVTAVTEVRYDPQGGYGQIGGTFLDGAYPTVGSVLTPGQDYYLQPDGRAELAGTSVSGTLWRNGSTWGYARGYKNGLLVADRVETRGTIKVTYNGGYVASDNSPANTMPGAVTAAIAQAVAVWWITNPNVGIMSGESGTGYSYNEIMGVNLKNTIFAVPRQLLAGLRRLRPGGGG